MNKKSVSVFDLVSIGVGCVIGAGIFSMLGVGIYYSGRGIVIAIVIAMLLVFVEYIKAFILSATFDLKGGTYEQAALTLPPVFTGAGAAITVIANLSLSVMGISIASYLAQLVPATAPFQKWIAFGIMTLLFASSIKGTKFMAKIQNVMVVCMYAALGLFIIFGLIRFNPSTYAGEPFLIQGPTGLFVAIAMMSFTCNGALTIINLSGDTEDATKKIPKALILTTLICTVIYALLAFSATHSLSYADVAGQNMGFIAQRTMPAGVYVFFMIGGAIFALATTLLGGISGLKWPILTSVEDGWFPAFLGKKTKKDFPWAIMLMMYLIAVVPIIGDFSLESIVSLIIVPGAISTILGNIINWRLPEKFPNSWSKNTLKMSATVYRVWMVLSTLCALFLSYFTLSTQSTTMIILNLGMTALLYVYAILRYKSGKVHLQSRDIYVD